LLWQDHFKVIEIGRIPLLNGRDEDHLRSTKKGRRSMANDRQSAQPEIQRSNDQLRNKIVKFFSSARTMPAAFGPTRTQWQLNKDTIDESASQMNQINAQNHRNPSDQAPVAQTKQGRMNYVSRAASITHTSPASQPGSTPAHDLVAPDLEKNAPQGPVARDIAKNEYDQYGMEDLPASHGHNIKLPTSSPQPSLLSSETKGRQLEFGSEMPQLNTTLVGDPDTSPSYHRNDGIDHNLKIEKTEAAFGFEPWMIEDTGSDHDFEECVNNEESVHDATVKTSQIHGTFDEDFVDLLWTQTDVHALLLAASHIVQVPGLQLKISGLLSQLALDLVVESTSTNDRAIAQLMHRRANSIVEALVCRLEGDPNIPKTNAGLTNDLEPKIPGTKPTLVEDISELDTPLPTQAEITQFVIPSFAFQSLRRSLNELAWPSFSTILQNLATPGLVTMSADDASRVRRLVRELKVSHPSTITYSEAEPTFFDFVRFRIEEITQQEWDWWPLLSPKEPLRKGHVRVEWRTYASQNVSFGYNVADILRLLVRFAGGTSQQTSQSSLIKRLRLIGSRATLPLIMKFCFHSASHARTIRQSCLQKQHFYLSR
jgi:hypothetical protein